METEQPPKKTGVNLFFLFLAFVLGFGGVLAFQYLRAPKHTATMATLTEITPESSPQPTLALNPPAQALSGELTITKGKADIFTRSADAYAEASSGATILLGESVATKEDTSATITIPSVVTAIMDEVAEVVFANLFADNIVLQQKGGKVTYQMADGAKPVAVRALHTLISIRSGEAVINIIDTDMSVTVKTGSVKLALVDSDNNTNVWEINEGQRANIDDSERKVYLIKSQ